MGRLIFWLEVPVFWLKVPETPPGELVQVVGYLQSVTDKIGIDLVAVSAYTVAGSRVLVPQRVDRAAVAASCPMPR